MAMHGIDAIAGRRRAPEKHLPAIEQLSQLIRGVAGERPAQLLPDLGRQRLRHARFVIRPGVAGGEDGGHQLVVRQRGLIGRHVGHRD
jgi:hypothetical protein